MKRFRFLAWAGTTLLAGLLPAVSQTWRETADTGVPPLNREFRGAWLTTVYNLDWPSRSGLGMDAQQRELRSLLDKAAALRLNAVLLQVRPGGDALYSSKLEPWSAVLTGKMGKDPGYDPLALAVEEAHRRGLELHAWFNPFRAKAGQAPADAGHWTERHPEWIRGEKSHLFMDPGVPEVQSHVLAVMQDVLTRYDIDGIHIDDYFYPYPVFGPGAVRLEVPLGDEERWKLHGGELNLADWRRDNINRFIKSMYSLTRRVKPAARVGISPFGIWQPGIPEGIEARVNARDHLYGDSRRWLQEGWCDYLAPQLYWPLEPAKQSFSTLLNWWTAQSTGRPVWPGISVERIASTKAPALPVRELTDQLDVVRKASASPGALLWRIKSLATDARGTGTLLRDQTYRKQALPPPAPWLDAGLPGKPTLKIAPAGVDVSRQELKVSWVETGTLPVRWWALQIKRKGQWEQQPLLFGSTSSLLVSETVEGIALRAVSASGMEGTPAVWARIP